ncbi:hypothetical protein, partial [Burkholderia humptydooensis]|uniref:hypothetical protein n=1 Tax=Burkholderia humptydooensis TaxID=430531 RepID=UPI001E46F911
MRAHKLFLENSPIDRSTATRPRAADRAAGGPARPLGKTRRRSPPRRRGQHLRDERMMLAA